MLRGISVQEDNQISNRGEDKMIVEEVTEELPPTRRQGTGRRWGCRASCGVVAAQERKASGLQAKEGEVGQFLFFSAMIARWKGLRTR